jgi:hypothetical protein
MEISVRGALLALVAFSAAVAHVLSMQAAAPAANLRPPDRLSATGLYAADGGSIVDSRNLLFSPQYPLWSDNATKRRWVYLPPGATIDATDPNAWDLPVGTRFWKEFTFNRRKVETRMLWKASEVRWVAASYMWNDEQTEAVLAPESGVPGVVEVGPGRRHTIPGTADCFACHGAARPRPLGFNALQLSADRDPNAIHGERLTPDMLTLDTLVKDGILSSPGQPIDPRPRIRTDNPATRSVLGYLSANCGSCHNGNGEIAALGPVLKHADLVKDGDAVARSLVGLATTWQVPGVPDGASVLVDPRLPETSAIVARMRSRAPSTQMPPLGTVVRDDRALDIIRRWIAVDLTRTPRQAQGAATR